MTTPNNWEFRKLPEGWAWAVHERPGTAAKVSPAVFVTLLEWLADAARNGYDVDGGIHVRSDRNAGL